jgi:hypothetical protein
MGSGSEKNSYRSTTLHFNTIIVIQYISICLFNLLSIIRFTMQVFNISTYTVCTVAMYSIKMCYSKILASCFLLSSYTTQTLILQYKSESSKHPLNLVHPLKAYCTRTWGLDGCWQHCRYHTRRLCRVTVASASLSPPHSSQSAPAH